MENFIHTLWADESGQDLTEYVLLIVIIALGAVTAMGLFKDEIGKAFAKVTAAFGTATS